MNCSKCFKEYDDTLTSCPFRGGKKRDKSKSSRFPRKKESINGILFMFIAAVMVSVLITGCGGNSVVGTYKTSDGRIMVVSKDGFLTMTIPNSITGYTGKKPYTTPKLPYRVEGDTLVFPTTEVSQLQSQSRYKIEGKKLIWDSDVWVRQ